MKVILFHKTFRKLLLLLIAILIGLGSLIFTGTLVEKLRISERKNVELWAEATRLLSVSDTSQNVDFLFSIIDNNNTVPVILTDESENIISSKNIDGKKLSNPDFLRRTLISMREQNEPIVIGLEGNHFNLIFYRDSIILTMLRYYPYIQLSIIFMFILVSYLAFSSSRKAEQNQVWVGMSKETAHQLGTPTSSISGWIEIMQTRHPEIAIVAELARDVERLEKVTERFSKIGSKPLLTETNLEELITRTTDYLKSRVSSKVKITSEFETVKGFILPLSPSLFEWVIENIVKNSIDAMEGSGEILIKVFDSDKFAFIDITDTGRGIPKSAFKKIFSPGFTTKQRGWGLGLSLAKRIVEEYHNGKIFVRHSEEGKGSCIRIVLKKKKRT